MCRAGCGVSISPQPALCAVDGDLAFVPLWDRLTVGTTPCGDHSMWGPHAGTTPCIGGKFMVKWGQDGEDNLRA